MSLYGISKTGLPMSVAITLKSIVEELFGFYTLLVCACVSCGFSRMRTRIFRQMRLEALGVAWMTPQTCHYRFGNAGQSAYRLQAWVEDRKGLERSLAQSEASILPITVVILSRYKTYPCDFLVGMQSSVAKRAPIVFDQFSKMHILVLIPVLRSGFSPAELISCVSFLLL